MVTFKPEIIDRLVFLAKKSNMKHKHGALILKHGEIIGEGTNKIVDFMCHQYSIHSEVAAILSLKRQHRNKKFLEDAILIVVRVTGNMHQNFRMSSPCENCAKEIIKNGIKTVYYST